MPADLLNPAVTQETIGPTICTSGWTATVRPSTGFTTPLKTAQIGSYGYADTNPGDYEEDHVVALELGGAPASPANLFPEPHSVSTGDDGLENDLKAKVCGSTLRLDTAQEQLYASKVSHGYDHAKSTAVGATPSAATPANPATTAASAGGVYYANCSAARAAGAAPLHLGDPGYRPALDRDGDGIACE